MEDLRAELKPDETLWTATIKDKKMRHFVRLMGMGILSAALPVAAQAQTNTFPATGNVGIGTASLGQVLDVNGAVQMSMPNQGFVAMTLGDKLASTENKGWLLRAEADAGLWQGISDSLDFGNRLWSSRYLEQHQNKYQVEVTTTKEKSVQARMINDYMLYQCSQEGSVPQIPRNSRGQTLFKAMHLRTTQGDPLALLHERLSNRTPVRAAATAISLGLDNFSFQPRSTIAFLFHERMGIC